MTDARPLWDEPERPNSISPAAVSLNPQRPKIIQGLVNGFSIDIHGWLEANEPQQFSQLMDLRRALYSFRSRGKYRIRYRQTVTERSFVLIGPVGRLLIRSDRARYYLLRQLSKLRRQKRWPPIKYKRTSDEPTAYSRQCIAPACPFNALRKSSCGDADDEETCWCPSRRPNRGLDQLPPLPQST